MRFGLMAAMAALFAVLAGCAGMSKEECALQDWYARGKADGANGVGVERFGGYTRTCSRHGIAPDYNAYQAGRADGLEIFCTPTGVYTAGLRGRGNISSCGYDPDLLRIHQVTTSFARADNELRSLENRQDWLRSSLARGQDRLFDVQDKLIEDDLEKEEREELRDKLHDIRDDLRRWEQEEQDIRFRLRRAEADRGAAAEALRQLEFELGLSPLPRF